MEWEVRSYWEARAGTYDDSPWHVCCSDIWARLLDEVAPPPHRVSLDVGTGTGFMASILAERSSFVVALDIAEAMLREARGKLWWAPNVELVEADAAHLPLRSGSVDFATARHVLWTLPDPAGFAAELARVLRCGGVAVATHTPGLRASRPGLPETPLAGATSEDAARLLAEAGLRVVIVDASDARMEMARRIGCEPKSLPYHLLVASKP